MTDAVQYYKVTRPDGESIRGGALRWSLPTADGPGDWHEVAGAIRLCASGLHLTAEPARWWRPGARCFRVEHSAPLGTEGDKIVVARARCVEEVAWESVLVFQSGQHEVRGGFAVASGSATVRAFDSATVRAFDSATVQASGSATVWASDSATVTSSAYHVEPSGKVTLLSYHAAHLIRSHHARPRLRLRGDA